MTDNTQKSNRILIIVAIIGVIGSVIAAAVTVIGNISVEKIRQETELTRVALAQGNGVQTIIYDVFDDFSLISNPSSSSPWTYGYTLLLGGKFDVYATLSHDINQEKVILWTRPENYLTPNISLNTSGKDIINSDGCILHPPKEYIQLHPGENNEFSVVRWTAHVNGTYIIETAFKSLRFCSKPTSTDVHVLYNSTSIFNAVINELITGGDHVFSTTITLTMGDTIDFVVGVGDNGNYDSDSTGLRATIKLVSTK